jgi:DNA invertase Pin-like site-specific DNA recombinase
MKVLHRCDTPSCVNPAHLFIGTQKDNIDDMRRKGRDRFDANPPRGARQWTAKLTDETVREIRADKRKQTAIAAAYGITQSQVSRLKNGKRWQHLGE